MEAVMDTNLKAPFPYFGGKGIIADKIWKYLGDCKQYIEPFFGSGAVLLKRPPTKLAKIYEIVNDKDGHIANVWRSIEFKPDEVARWCCWPVNHADLIARKKALMINEANILDGLQKDDMWCDPKMAGYWVWACSCWIGSGMLCPSQRPHLAGDKGITSQRPHLTGDNGITSKIPHLTGDKGITSQMPHLTGDKGVYEWLRALSARLRNVKVVCGDWTRVCGGNWQDNNKPVGMFFDPPYMTAGRDEKIYMHDSITVGGEVEKWVLERGKNPNYRIVAAGYDDEYKSLLNNGWIAEAWSAAGGYSRKNTRGATNRHRERLFISPYCENLKNNNNELFGTQQ